jgi:hypothetical protein
MHNQRGHVELLEVLMEVGLGKCLDAVVKIFETAKYGRELRAT